MKAVILAAGKGDNLKPFSDTRPNPMISVAGKYLFDHNLDLLQKAGVNDIFVVVGHQKDKLIERIGEHVHNGLNIQYVEQKRADGIGNAVLKVKDKILPGEYFLLIYGDIVTAENIFTKTQQSFHAFKGPVASICLPSSNEMFGNVFLNANMNITKIIEKPKGDNLGNYVLSGVYVLPQNFFELLEKNGRSMEKAIKELVKDEGLRASMWEDEWLDVVYPLGNSEGQSNHYGFLGVLANIQNSDSGSECDHSGNGSYWRRCGDQSRSGAGGTLFYWQRMLYRKQFPDTQLHFAREQLLRWIWRRTEKLCGATELSYWPLVVYWRQCFGRECGHRRRNHDR